MEMADHLDRFWKQTRTTGLYAVKSVQSIGTRQYQPYHTPVTHNHSQTPQADPTAQHTNDVQGFRELAIKVNADIHTLENMTTEYNRLKNQLTVDVDRLIRFQGVYEKNKTLYHRVLACLNVKNREDIAFEQAMNAMKHQIQITGVLSLPQEPSQTERIACHLTQGIVKGMNAANARFTSR